MAASTWFHGSQWPPSNHGIMPSARCTAAMAWPVAEHVGAGTGCRAPRAARLAAERSSSVVMLRPPGSVCSGPRRPGTPRGTLGRASGRPATAVFGLGQVDHQALADQRAEHPVGRPRHGRRLDDVPHQHLVVRGHGRVARRWRARPGNAATSRASAGRGRGGSPWARSPVEREPPLERRAAVDADVAARRVVVLVGERPVDRLGHAARHGHRHRPARPQHPGQLAHGRRVVGDVLEDLRGDDAVEGAVGEGQRQRVALHRRGRMVRGQLPCLHHGAQRPEHLGHLVGAGVESHHRRAAARRLEGVPPEATAEVEQPVARRDAEPVVVDGQHQAASCRRAESACRGARERQTLEDGPVAGGRPGRGDLPGEAADDPFAAGRARGGPAAPGRRAGGRWRRRARRGRRAGPAGRSRRRRPPPRARRRRSSPPVRRRRTSPRWPAARSPRRARAPRPPRPRRRAGPAPRR